MGKYIELGHNERIGLIINARDKNFNLNFVWFDSDAIPIYKKSNKAKNIVYDKENFEYCIDKIRSMGYRAIIVSEHFTLSLDREYLDEFWDFCDFYTIRVKGSNRSKAINPSFDDKKSLPRVYKYLSENNIMFE